MRKIVRIVEVKRRDRRAALRRACPHCGNRIPWRKVKCRRCLFVVYEVASPGRLNVDERSGKPLRECPACYQPILLLASACRFCLFMFAPFKIVQS